MQGVGPPRWVTSSYSDKIDCVEVADKNRDLIVGITFKEAHADLNAPAVGLCGHPRAEQNLERGAASGAGGNRDALTDAAGVPVRLGRVAS